MRTGQIGEALRYLSRIPDKQTAFGDKLIPRLRIKRLLSRILLMSASKPWTLRRRGMHAILPAYPFLQKPFTKQALLDKVQAVLSSPVPSSKSSRALGHGDLPR